MSVRTAQYWGHSTQPAGGTVVVRRRRRPTARRPRVTDAQQELRHQAFHDPLTGLANRALFADRLRHGLALHRRDLRPLSLLYCDLDAFKSVNDILGHDAGDEVLKAVAERLRAVTRTGDTVARMGGDEFALLLEDGGDAITVAAHILQAFSQPASVGGHTVPLGTSIGVAELGPADPPVTPEELLSRADTAMYQAKRGGKNTAVTWTATPTRVTTAAATQRDDGTPAVRSGAGRVVGPDRTHRDHL